jgi:hypothetical protein
MKRYGTIIFILLVSIAAFSSAGNKASADNYFDSYRNLTWREERAHLENFAIALRRHPEMVGYIGYYVGEKSSTKSVNDRIERAKKYLISEFKIEASRIIIVNLGKQEETLTILQPSEKNKSPF